MTAGVLRGDKARFQLFGDTMNVASRMETTSKPNWVQVSKETGMFIILRTASKPLPHVAQCFLLGMSSTAANLLIEAGKESWVSERSDKVNIHGKGQLRTFWLSLDAKDARAAAGSGTKTVSVMSDDEIQLDDELGDCHKIARLVDWNVECLANILKQVIARREAIDRVDPWGPSHSNAGGELSTKVGSTVIDEVAEIIALPEFDPRAVKYEDPESIIIPEEVMTQLRDYVSKVADMYRSKSEATVRRFRVIISIFVLLTFLSFSPMYRQPISQL